MSPAVRKHTLKFPNARTTTIAYLEKREEMTARLRAEVSSSRRVPLLRRLLDLVRGR